MNSRVFLSLLLIGLALVLVLLPENNIKKNQLRPLEYSAGLDKLIEPMGIDQAARHLANTDSTIQCIDIRQPEAFLYCHIPGAINIPYPQLFDKNRQGYLNPTQKTNVIYANDDLQSHMAVALLKSEGYTNNKVLQGGLNAWFGQVMEAAFSGGRISARENALYENRRKAKQLFTEWNSLPDSLKNTYLETKILDEAKLDGGCE